MVSIEVYVQSEIVSMIPNFVDIFSYSGPSGILGSDGKQNTTLINVKAPEVTTTNWCRLNSTLEMA